MQRYPCRPISSSSAVGDVCTISFFNSPISSTNVSISCKKAEEENRRKEEKMQQKEEAVLDLIS